MNNFPNQEKATNREMVKRVKKWRSILKPTARQTANPAYWNEADERAYKAICALLEETRDLPTEAENLLCSALEREPWINAASKFLEKIRDYTYGGEGKE